MAIHVGLTIHAIMVALAKLLMKMIGNVSAHLDIVEHNVKSVSTRSVRNVYQSLNKQRLIMTRNGDSYISYISTVHQIAVCAPNPCLNGGLCQITEDGSYKCICSEGWEGQNCTKGKV